MLNNSQNPCKQVHLSLINSPAMALGKKRERLRHETKQEEREQDATKKMMKTICSARDFYGLFTSQTSIVLGEPTQQQCCQLQN